MDECDTNSCVDVLDIVEGHSTDDSLTSIEEEKETVKKTPVGKKKKNSLSGINKELTRLLRCYNPYCKFFLTNRTKIVEQFPDIRACHIVKIASLVWNRMSKAERQPYFDMAYEGRVNALLKYGSIETDPKNVKAITKKLNSVYAMGRMNLIKKSAKPKIVRMASPISKEKLVELTKLLTGKMGSTRNKKARNFENRGNRPVAAEKLPGKATLSPDEIVEISSDDDETDENSSMSVDDEKAAEGSNTTCSKCNYDTLKTMAKERIRKGGKVCVPEEVGECFEGSFRPLTQGERAGELFTEEFLTLDNALEKKMGEMLRKKACVDKQLEEALVGLEKDKEYLRKFRGTMSPADRQVDQAVVWLDLIYRWNLVNALCGLRNPGYTVPVNVKNIIDYLTVARNVVKENKPEHSRFICRFNDIMAALDMPSLNFSFLKGA